MKKPITNTIQMCLYKDDKIVLLGYMKTQEKYFFKFLVIDTEILL